MVNTKEAYVESYKELSPQEYLKIMAGPDFELLKLAEEVIKRESNWQIDVCNKKYGCQSGQGLFQLIPSTVIYCEKKLDRTINPFNAFDNIDCGWWLLKNEGIRHWDPYSGPY